LKLCKLIVDGYNTYGAVRMDYDGSILFTTRLDSCPNVADVVNLDSILSPDSVVTLLLQDTIRQSGWFTNYVSAYTGQVVERYCSGFCDPGPCCQPVDGDVVMSVDTIPAVSLIIAYGTLCYEIHVTGVPSDFPPVSIKRTPENPPAIIHTHENNITIYNPRRLRLQALVYSLNGKLLLRSTTSNSNLMHLNTRLLTAGMYPVIISGNKIALRYLIPVW